MSEQNGPMSHYASEYLNLLVQVPTDFEVNVPEGGDLVNFILGMSSPQEESWCLDALIRSSKLRHQLIQIQAQLSTETVASLDKQPSFGSSLSASVRAALGSLNGKFDVPAGVWRSIGQEWNRILDTPRFATVRGSEETISIRGTEQRIKLTADVVNGDLQVVLHPGQTKLTEVLTLALRDPSGTFLTLWQGMLGTESVPIFLTKLGTQLGFDDAPVPVSLFCLSIEPTFPEQSGTIDLELRNGRVVKLSLVGAISIQEGRLRLSVDVGSLSRTQDMEIQLMLQVGSVDLLLGKATMEKIQSELTFEVEIPALEPFEVSGTSLLKLVSSN
jgi:hypothetical protein